ncbi:anti-sigma factor family protein [Marinivivus vitaminiproducens]|uniref:anti-sigma factor family protein n=1 Tax=Marinivivus vitaminiproducens TaxID=3035935 RepID=UPI0027A5FF18|nr:hypothetical protein P4R82_05530 [Geminicoccaceae bacterium SCSIO 64248]
MDPSLRRVFTTDDLQSYVDGRLTLEERFQIEAWLVEDEQAARTVAEYRRQATALRAGLDRQVHPEGDVRLRAYAERLADLLRSAVNRRLI